MAFSLTSILPLPDMLALGWFFLCWVGYAWYADHRRWGTRELASVLHDYRLRWMRRVLERENRIADTVVLQTVMRSCNLFITTTLFIIAGLISSLGAVERVQAMVSGIGFIAVSSRETLELRLLVLIGIFVFAFFKFTWSLRQFNFTLMLFASAPMPAEKDAPDRADFAPRAAMMVTHGFASFNRGLRAYFFGLAALAWFIQPWAFVLAASWVVAVLYWRDSRSATLATLAGPVTGKEPP